MICRETSFPKQVHGSSPGGGPDSETWQEEGTPKAQQATEKEEGLQEGLIFPKDDPLSTIFHYDHKRGEEEEISKPENRQFLLS